MFHVLVLGNGEGNKMGQFINIKNPVKVEDHRNQNTGVRPERDPAGRGQKLTLIILVVGKRVECAKAEIPKRWVIKQEIRIVDL